MDEIKSAKPINNPVRRVIILVIGDLLTLLLFAWIGRRSHALLVTDLGAIVTTAAPFVMSWFVITPWFGLFSAEVSQNWRKLVPRLLIAWIIGAPLALLLRALWLGRSISGGLNPTFALVAFGFTTLFLLIWRLTYSWWANRATGSFPEAGEMNR